MNRTPRLSKSDIEYLDYVWNFESGCTKGCTYCYARDITVRFPAHYPNGFEPTLYPEAFTSPLRLKKPSIIGCVFMGDLFDDMVDPCYEHVLPSPDWCPTLRMPLREWIFGTINKCPQHKFLFLTKQPQNLAKWSPFPDNCWVGASVTNAHQLSDAYLGLSPIEATVKYISYEPLLSNVVLEPQFLKDAGINWAIIGAQTKPTVMPKLEWVKEIVEAADKAGIPVFLKDSLKPLFFQTCGGEDVINGENLWATRYFKLRQEMPK